MQESDPKLNVLLVYGINHNIFSNDRFSMRKRLQLIFRIDVGQMVGLVKLRPFQIL